MTDLTRRQNLEDSSNIGTATLRELEYFLSISLYGSETMVHGF